MSERRLGFAGQVRAVWRKEFTDAMRDRRSLMSALLYPILMPLMMTLMFGALARLEGSERPLELPIAGQERAPNLVAWLEERGVIVVDPPSDPEAAVRNGDVDLVLIIDEDYGEHFRSVQPAAVRLVRDSSRTASGSSIGRTRNLLRQYSNQVAVLRLVARGVSPGVMQAVQVDELDLATPAQSAARLFAMIPMLLILGAFIGGLNVAIDTTAGERERHSLEPLLVNPVSRTALTAGKWLTTCVFGLVASVLTLIAFLFMMRFVPLEQLEMQLNLGYPQLLLMVVAVAPVALLASGLQMFVATFSRSFKEAQTYVSVLIFLPMIPGMVTQIYPLQPAAWMMAVPALSQQLLLVDVMGGEGVSIPGLVGSAAATTVLAFVFLALTSRMLSQEKIIFGRT
ncbi:MAG: ABC transporter permease [Acidobacteria bacterium]|nr:ABC transporter permease [Acidobacteriota bacterium]MYJ05070.1 ABC transporter permease [Acidobacteriota bacterium]